MLSAYAPPISVSKVAMVALLGWDCGRMMGRAGLPLRAGPGWGRTLGSLAPRL